MKKKHVLILTAAIAGAVALGAGCGKKMTPESLIEAVTKNTQEKKSVEANMMMNFEGSVAADQDGASVGVDMNMNMDMDLQALYNKDDPNETASYLNGTMKVAMLGANVSFDMENYTVPEDGKLAVYTGTQGQWMRQEQEIGEGGSVQSDMLGMDLKGFVEDGGKVSLADETETVGDKKCYKLTIGVSGDVLVDMMGMSAGMMGDALPTDGLDFSDATLDYVMYIDKKEKLPVKIVVDGTSLMDSVMSSIEESGVSMDVSKFDLSLEITGYDTVDAITVPDDVKAQAIDAGSADDLLGDDLLGDDLLDDDLGGDTLGDAFGGDDDDDVDFEEETGETDADGNRVITSYEGTHKATIVMPEGFAENYASDTFLGIVGDHCDATYRFLDYTTSDDMKKDTKEDYIGENSDSYSDYKRSDVMSFDLNGQKVQWFTESYTYLDMNAIDAKVWIEVEEAVMFVGEINKYGSSEETIDITQEEVAALLGGVTIQ